MSTDLLLTTGSASRRAGISREWVVHLCKTGHLPHVRDESGRRLIRERDLLRLIEERQARRRALLEYAARLHGAEVTRPR